MSVKKGRQNSHLFHFLTAITVFGSKQLYWHSSNSPSMDKTKVTHRQGLQQIIDQLPAVIFEYNAHADGGREFTYLSPRCIEVLGVTPAELSAGTFPAEQFIHSEDWAGFIDSTRKSSETSREWKWEGRICHNGKTTWIEAVGTPSSHADGRVSWSGMITDISRRKNLEQRQRETETTHRNLLEQLPLGVGVHKHGKLVYVNTYALKMMLAKDSGELIGKNVIDFVHPDDKELAIARVKLALAGQNTGVIEEKYIRVDGKVINVEVSSHPVTYEGEPAVQVIVKDVTERKEAEASIRKAETLFSQLFQNSPMAIVMLSERGTVVKINRGFEEMFGYTLGELEGKELNQFIVPEGLESEGNDLDTLIGSYQVIRIETTRIQRSGKPLSVIIYGVPVHLNETTIGIFGVYVDITDRKKVEEELKVRNTELDNFVYKVSHDLRAPLSSILGLVNLANLQGNEDNLRDYIPLVGQKVKTLDHFISDVLSHSKNLKLDVKTDLIDLRKIIDLTFKDLGYLTGVEEIRKKILVSGVDFYSDQWRIGEIFRNLISNAIKYRKLDHPTPTIEISANSTPEATEIIFKDNGIGIPPENMGRIFEMFYRASEQSEGSGLGLYIVKNAIDKLEGVVLVESEFGQGTTFKITLPNHIVKD